MPDFGKTLLFASVGIAAFSLLLLIISVGVPNWLDDGAGNTVGLFRKCYGSNTTSYGANLTEGCVNENRVTQGGLSVFGLLLLAFAVIIGVVAGWKTDMALLLYATLGLMYFSSMFVMSAYATWGTYAREPALYLHPVISVDEKSHHTSMGPGYHLCVAAHFFLWTALTLLAFAVGHASASRDSSGGTS